MKTTWSLTDGLEKSKGLVKDESGRGSRESDPLDNKEIMY
jgi:hypothetical protein